MPSPDTSPEASASTRLLPIALGIALCEGVGVLAGIATQSSVDTWYPALDKPWFTPPDAVFAPIWIVLYAMMGVALGRVWQGRRRHGRRAALVWFGVQLALNAAWSVVFFGLQSVGGGLLVIGGLWLALAATIRRFFTVDRAAGWLLVPYLLWVSYAAALNAGIFRAMGA